MKRLRHIVEKSNLVPTPCLLMAWQNSRLFVVRVTTLFRISTWRVNTLRPRHYGRHFPDDIFKCICLNENVSISLKISLKFVPKVQFNNIPALFQIMAWCRPGDKPLSEPMVVNLLTHICVTRPQWVNSSRIGQNSPHFFRRYFQISLL